jgi:hypothetical protein
VGRKLTSARVHCSPLTTFYSPLPCAEVDQMSLEPWFPEGGLAAGHHFVVGMDEASGPIWGTVQPRSSQERFAQSPHPQNDSEWPQPTPASPSCGSWLSLGETPPAGCSLPASPVLTPSPPSSPLPSLRASLLSRWLCQPPGRPVTLPCPSLCPEQLFCFCNFFAASPHQALGWHVLPLGPQSRTVLGTWLALRKCWGGCEPAQGRAPRVCTAPGGSSWGAWA